MSPTKSSGRRNGKAPYVDQALEHTCFNTYGYQAKMGVYPFMFGTVTDFEPVVQSIVKVLPISQILRRPLTRGRKA